MSDIIKFNRIELLTMRVIKNTIEILKQLIFFIMKLDPEDQNVFQIKGNPDKRR